MTKITILSSKVDAIRLEQAVDIISDWASKRDSRAVAFCNVHSVVTARHDQSFQNVLAKSDLVAPDGAPIAWAMRCFGAQRQERVSGPDFMWRYMAHAELVGQSVFLYGGTEETLIHLKRKLESTFPKLQIAGTLSPPFRPLTEEEDRNHVETINRSGTHTVWVSLGCPKQERWMDAHHHIINAVMLGVGAAFEFHAGTLRRAPVWMQRSGLEWAYRLSQQPKTLWRRYLFTNAFFVLGLARELFVRLFRSS